MKIRKTSAQTLSPPKRAAQARNPQRMLSTKAALVKPETEVRAAVVSWVGESKKKPAIPTRYRRELEQLVERIVRESGDPRRRRTFDAPGWVSRWIHVPHRALGGKPPAVFMRSAAGREQVMDLLKRMQTGAYS
jgi:Protein of unknown function (DUF2384)